MKYKPKKKNILKLQKFISNDNNFVKVTQDKKDNQNESDNMDR